MSTPVPSSEIADTQTDGFLPADVVSRLKAKNVPFAAIKTPAGVVAIRKPTRAEYKRFMSQAGDDKVVAMENLALSCLEHPAPAVFNAWLEDKPGISGSVANTALDMIGVEKDPEVKKY